jgi:hypothetical protein
LVEKKDADSFRGTFVPGKMIVDGAVQTYEVDDVMIDSVQEYLDVVWGHMERLGSEAKLFVETRVYPVLEDDRFYGTADAIIIEDCLYGELIVIDLKYGRGVVVEVKDNGQAKFYGLGALRTVEGISEIRNIIVQPRAFHPDGSVREEILAPSVLREFAGVLIGAAALTEDPNAPRVAGDWCRFCPAKSSNAGVCPALKEKGKEIMRADFSDIIENARRGDMPDPSDVVTLPDEEDVEGLAKAWLAIKYMDFAVSGITAMVQRRVESGKDFDWAKMVRKRSNRRFIEEDLEQLELDMINAVRRAEASTGEKFGRSVIYKPRVLKSPSALEKVSYIPEGKKRAVKVLKEYVKDAAEKTEGGLTLVGIDDARPAVPQETLAEHFADSIAKYKHLIEGKDAPEETEDN